MSAMATFDSQELTNAVHAVLRTAASLSSGSMVYPYDASVVWTQRRAVRSPKPKQWLIERETFERDVVSQYNALEYGVIRELVAGTGVGKTTVMPFRIAEKAQVNGLVLVPEPLYALRNVRYLTTKLLAEGNTVRTTLLRSAHLVSPPASPVVYFTDADTFLGRLCKKPSLLRDLGIDFIYLDESHSPSAGYNFFQHAVSVRIIEDCRVFFGTATASADMSMESGGVGRSVQAVDPRIMCVENPRAVTDRSPLHHRSIENRTLILLATDAEINAWYDYYEAHDIPVYRCSYRLGDKAKNGVDAFLDQYPTCVLLTTNVFRTNVTLNIDDVICGGYVQKVVSDFASGTVALKRVPVTMAQRIQGMGRVGRHKYGRGFYSNVEVTPISADLDHDEAFYVYLWSIMFNVTINDPTISQFADLFSTPLSSQAAAHLLHGRLPPLLMVPYVGNKGFFEGWTGVADYVLYSHGGCGTSDDSPVNTDGWKPYNTGAVPYVNVPYEFKAAVQFPKEWNVIPAYAWAMFQGNDTKAGLMRAASVISATSTVRPPTVRNANASRLSVDTVTSHQTSLWTSGRTTLQSLGDARRPVEHTAPLHRNSVTSAVTSAREALNVPSLDAVRDVYAVSVRDSLPVVTAPPPKYHARGNSADDTAHSIAKWRGDVPTSPNRDGSVYRVGSDSSDDRNAIKLKAVDPVKYKYSKLYPMDTDLFEQFSGREYADRTDRGRVDKLLTGRENINNMRADSSSRKERQGNYFLSTIRVHNAALIQKYQLIANESVSIMGKMHMVINGTVATTSTTINETARLLQAFQLESYFVGIDRRTPRSEDGTTVFTPDYDYDEARARIMMSLGPKTVIEVLNDYIALYEPFAVAGKHIANAWHFGSVILTACHAYDDVKNLPDGASAVLASPDDDDYIVLTPKEKKSCAVILRNAEAAENVYVVVYDKSQDKPVVLGDYLYTPAGEIGYIGTELVKGSSGALVVSVHDGAILGLYVSYFAHMRDGPVSLVVPSVRFSSYV